MKVSRILYVARSDPACLTGRARAELRRVRLEAGGVLRTAIARSVVPRRAGEAQVRYFAALDAHTLNLCVQLAEPCTGAEVVFMRQGREVRAPATVDGRRVTAVASLGELTEGDWQVALEVADGRRIRLTGDGRRAEDGPTVTSSPDPRTGRTVEAVMTVGGRCTVNVSQALPSAEVDEIRITAQAVRVRGRFVGCGVVAEATFRFKARGGASCQARAQVDEAGFHVLVPVAEMVTGDDGDIWDVAAVLDGHRSLRVGRFLHDVRAPRKVFRVPTRPVTTRPGVLARVRPYYTPAGSLAVECARFSIFSGVAQ